LDGASDIILLQQLQPMRYSTPEKGKMQIIGTHTVGLQVHFLYELANFAQTFASLAVKKEGF
jgi:hypothetical protein